MGSAAFRPLHKHGFGYARLVPIGAISDERVDAVFRKILRQPHFTWAEYGDALLRGRELWYYEHEPRPHHTVIGAGLSELVSR